MKQANLDYFAPGSSAEDAQRNVLQDHFAMRLSARLGERSEQLPHDISERLRFGRETALKRASELRRKQLNALTATGIAGIGQGTISLSGPKHSPWWIKLGSFVPLVGLVLGLVLIQQGQIHEQIMAAADVDTALLADNLPPDAYSDPGFSEYLSTDKE
jgi:hypothetical protein